MREDVTRAYENHHNTAEMFLNDFQSLRLLYITTDSFERIRIWKMSRLSTINKLFSDFEYLRLIASNNPNRECRLTYQYENQVIVES